MQWKICHVKATADRSTNDYRQQRLDCYEGHNVMGLLCAHAHVNIDNAHDNMTTFGWQ